MRWDPKAGHVPRGFRGACGEISDVELVLILAEPGNPLPNESHSGHLQEAYKYATDSLREGKSLVQRNLLKIIDLCWPGMNFDQQMKKVWITESVLCSAPKESGPVPREVEHACSQRYLSAQLALFPNALIVALGTKAKRRLRKHVGFTSSYHPRVRQFLPAFAVAPPGCNSREARPSWERISREVRRRNPHA
jgi:Uracil DNA glycosylase superfamily